MLDVVLDADPEWDSSTDWQALAEASCNAAIAESAFPQLAARDVELSMRLAGNEEVRGLNAEWRDKDKPTNVLSFPMAGADDLKSKANGPGLMLGDIILAHGVCASEAMEKDVALDVHAAHLMVHGTLHLLGYDHMDEDSAADMEAREIRALARIGIADPYAGDAC